jgi:hypothetical protein
MVRKTVKYGEPSSVARYEFKQALRKFQGLPPDTSPLVIQKAEQALTQQFTNWGLAWKDIHSQWLDIVPILLNAGIPRIEWGKYRAFLMKLVSKVERVPAGDIDTIRTWAVNIMGLDAGVVDEIIRVLVGA